MKDHYQTVCKYKHVNKINSEHLICFDCSSSIHLAEYGRIIPTIKPQKFEVQREIDYPNIISIFNSSYPKSFINKQDFLKLRNKIVKKMKQFCSSFGLSKKTFFLSLDYFDRICSKIPTFEMEDLLQISQICIILATKFQESQIKYVQVKSSVGPINNYSKDELFLLQLLDYDLLVHTAYDILIDIMHYGFIFQGEIFSYKKMNFVYGKMENMLYFFSETKSYIDMTPKEIALSLIGLIREILGLPAYNNNIKNIFMNEHENIQHYHECLNKLRKFFKIKDDNNSNHSDSNTDSNSDNSFDSNSDNRNETNNNFNNNIQYNSNNC